MISTDKILLILFALVVFGYVIVTVIGIPIIKNEQYTVTINSKWVQEDCGWLHCANPYMIDADFGKFPVGSFEQYEIIQPNKSYIIETTNIGDDNGLICRLNMCRVVHNVTVI